MEIVFDKINFDSLVQIGLIIVFIIQTGYLARQTNFGRRSSQASLIEVWNKEFVNINLESLTPEKGKSPDPVQFIQLVQVLHKMHSYFREKLLKPSDFSIMFILLSFATRYDELRKTDEYNENYLKLQEIFNDFNKDVEVALFFFSLPPKSLYEEALQNVSLTKHDKKLGEKYMHNWAKLQIWFRIWFWFRIKIKRDYIFKLEVPLK